MLVFDRRSLRFVQILSSIDAYLTLFMLITDVLFPLLKTVIFPALCHHPSRKTIYKRTSLKTTRKIGLMRLLSIICHLAQFLFLQKTDQKTKFCCQTIRSKVFKFVAMPISFDINSYCQTKKQPQIVLFFC